MLGAFAAWTAIVIGVIRYSGMKREKSQNAGEDRLMTAVKEQSTAAYKAHDHLADQIKDIATTMREGYVDRREFDTTIRALNNGLNQLGRDIGGVGNRVDTVGRRIDTIMDSLSLRRNRMEEG